MAIEKYILIGLLLVAVAFATFVFMQSSQRTQGISAHQVNEAAKPTYTLPPSSQQSAAGAQAGGVSSPLTGSGSTVQEVSLAATGYGYDKEKIVVKAGVPVHFTFTATNAGCCAQLLIDKVGVQLVSRNGQAVDATFTPPAPGEYPYHCGMNMCRGVLVAE